MKEFVGDSIIVGHNIEFDCGFLHAHGSRYNIDFTNRKLDTISIAKTIFRDKIQSYSLSALTKMFGIRYMSHRALNIFRTNSCFGKYLPHCSLFVKDMSA